MNLCICMISITSICISVFRFLVLFRSRFLVLLLRASGVHTQCIDHGGSTTIDERRWMGFNWYP